MQNRFNPAIITCPKCCRAMLDGEIVVMDWSGNAQMHVQCSLPAQCVISAKEELCFTAA